MTLRQWYKRKEVIYILNESSDDWYKIESKREYETSFSDLEEHDSNNRTGTVSYDVGLEYAWYDRQYHQFLRLYFNGSSECKQLFRTRLFVTSLILELIVDETNRQAEKLLLQDLHKPHARLRKWVINQDVL